jgi:hypothetical protein
MLLIVFNLRPRFYPVRANPANHFFFCRRRLPHAYVLTSAALKFSLVNHPSKLGRYKLPASDATMIEGAGYNRELHLRRVESKVPPLLIGATKLMNPIPLTRSTKPVCAANAPLVWVLRANVGFTGTRIGYRQNLCAARATAVRSR